MINRIFFLTNLLLIVLFTGVVQNVNAQSHNERVTVVGSFQPKISEFNKVHVEPTSDQAVFQQPKVEYSFINMMAETKTELEKIPPLVVNPDRSSDAFNNYFRFAFGSLLSPFVLFQHHSELSDKTAFSLGIRHASTWSDVKDHAPSTFMNNALNTSINHQLTNHKISAGIGYSHNLLHYYGFNPSDYGVTIQKSDINQAYQTITFASTLESQYNEISRFHHAIGLDYCFFGNKMSTSENHIGLSAMGRKDFELFDFGGNQSIGIKTSLDYYSNKDSLQSSGNGKLELTPGFTLSGDFFKLSLGLRLDAMFGDSSQTHLSPDVSANLFLLENALDVYVTLTGGVNWNGFSKLASENPFISPIVPLGWEKIKLDLKAGMRAMPLKNLDLHAGIRYAMVENMAFFITDGLSDYNNTFTMVYDKVGQFTFNADASFRLNQSVSFTGQLKVNHFSTDQQTKAWYKPAFEFKASTDVRPVDRLTLSGSLLFAGKRYAPTYAGTIETIHELDPFLDLNLAAEYSISRQFTVFTELTNLLGTGYEKYYHYPVHGLQLFGGLSYKF
ncbi:MAG: TonB-dependent receptor [Bacteroidales bacterium]|nr:TonB-dependent receptor [Bacteroidales bacterium]